MRQIFRRRSNAISRFSLIFLLVGLPIGALTFWTALKWSSWQTEVNVPYEQPVPFSHQHHVAGLGLDCRYCHTTVETSASAGMPPTHTCMTCHSQIWQNAAILEPVRESYAKHIPLKWNRVYRIPKYVYFNHSIHVNKGVGCTSCHGEIGAMPMTWKESPFYMRNCLACHRDPETRLRPQSEVFDPFWIKPENQESIGRRLVKENHIPKERLTDCYTCHR